MGLGVVLAATVLGGGARGLTAQSAPSAEEAGVRKALEAYFQGHATGQGEHYRHGMHADMRMSFVRDGKLVHRNLDEFAGGATGNARNVGSPIIEMCTSPSDKSTEFRYSPRLFCVNFVT